MIELVKAYYQIKLAPHGIPNTATSTPFDLFKFLPMSLGLRNAAQTVHCFIDTVMLGFRLYV